MRQKGIISNGLNTHNFFLINEMADFIECERLARFIPRNVWKMIWFLLKIVSLFALLLVNSIWMAMMLDPVQDTTRQWTHLIANKMNQRKFLEMFNVAMTSAQWCWIDRRAQWRWCWWLTSLCRTHTQSNSHWSFFVGDCRCSPGHVRLICIRTVDASIALHVIADRITYETGYRVQMKFEFSTCCLRFERK